MAADHAETRRAAIHFIDLLDVLKLADAFFLFTEMPLFISERGLRVLRFRDRELSIERDLVMRGGLGRYQLFAEI